MRDCLSLKMITFLRNLAAQISQKEKDKANPKENIHTIYSDRSCKIVKNFQKNIRLTGNGSFNFLNIL